MHKNIPDSPVLELLTTFQGVVKPLGIDFFIVGAIARDIRLSANPQMKPLRQTKDVDIALLVADESQFYQVKDALLGTGLFTAHATEAIKLFYKESIELDLLPFGEIENHARETRLHKPRPFVMDMPGFSEIMPHVEEFEINGLSSFKVCTLEGLVLLKLIANDDNPSRIKDITDIQHIVSVYFELCMEDVFSNYADVAELYDTSINNYMHLVAARIIGRKINFLLQNSKDLHKRILSILNKRASGELWQAMTDGIHDT
jgi:predicted nucleotidyltransferase